MGKLCETNAIEATMSLMGNEEWKSLSDDTLIVRCIILPLLVITITAKHLKTHD